MWWGYLGSSRPAGPPPTTQTLVRIAVIFQSPDRTSRLRWHEPSAVHLGVGSMLYLVGNLLVTIVFNVPIKR
jgi:uncharacterized membrane protein